jgi:hypothetical protein
MPREVKINRAPVLTLWAAVVAERLGFERAEALTLGRAVAGLNAYSKGVALGVFTPSPAEVREQRRRMRPADTFSVELLHRAVRAVRTPEGIRALSKQHPIEPESVERYLAEKFGDALEEVREAMVQLARAREPEQLTRDAYALYEQFRPQIPPGRKGWGAAGALRLDAIRALAGKASRAR